MMNSPCAMLMTFIWPKVSDRPMAMSSSTAPMLMPVKSWLATRVTTLTSGAGWAEGEWGARAGWLPRPGGVGSGQAAGPGVVLQVRVRLDRLAGVPHLGDQPVRADLADP